MLVGLVSCEASVRGLLTAASSLCPHVAFSCAHSPWCLIRTPLLISHIGHLKMSYRHLVKTQCALNLPFGFHTCINFGKNCFDSSRYLWLYWSPKWNTHKTFDAFKEHWSKSVLFFHTCIHFLFPFSGWISFVKQFKNCLMFLQVFPSAAIVTLGSTCYLKDKQKDWKGP